MSSMQFGGSLPVDNVQDLASKHLSQIPSRYVRPELDSETVTTTTTTTDDDGSLEVPVIDLSKLLDKESASEELAKFHTACCDWGFFQLINHGIPEKVIEKMKVDTEEFFKLPSNEKKVYSQLPNSVEGYGQAFVVSDEQKLDWGDMFFLMSLPAKNRQMRVWPNNPLSFRETLDNYAIELHRVTVDLVTLMEKNLGIESETLKNVFEVDGRQTLRMNYYPPCFEAEKVMGISPHSDATGLTLLLQINNVPGLQIRKNGKWIPINPISGAFIVNIGDVIEIMSNGIYKSIEHRAVINPAKERLSVAAFHSPRFGTPIGPVKALAKDHKARYMTVSHEDYLRQVMTTKLDGKNLLDLMKVQL